MNTETVTLLSQEEVVQEINRLLPTPAPGESHLGQPDSEAFHMEINDAEEIVTRVAQLRQEKESWEQRELRQQLADVLGQSRSSFWKSIGPDDLLRKITVL